MSRDLPGCVRLRLLVSFTYQQYPSLFPLSPIVFPYWALSFCACRVA